MHKNNYFYYLRQNNTNFLIKLLISALKNNFFQGKFKTNR